MAQKDRLAEINAELKAANIGVQVRQRGNRLCLRATLPPQPGSEDKKPHQQHIALGVYANPAGFKPAKAEVIVVGGLLACKEFSWEPYLKHWSMRERSPRDGSPSI